MPWLLSQVWHDLLFAHWPVTVEALRKVVPPGLALDLRDGVTWLAVTPFRMRGVRPRFLPALPWLSAFPELNVRTYVTLAGEKPGVFFFSLDAGNPVAVELARRTFHLSYYRAAMSVRARGEGEARTIHYSSRRTHQGAPAAELSATYRATGPAFRSAPGSLEHFLTERYCLYAVDERDRIYRADIAHAPWSLQPASATFETNSMAAAAGIDLPAVPPLLHFARTMQVVVWAPVRVGGGT